MNREEFRQRLEELAAALGVELPGAEAIEKTARHLELLYQWNQRLNLTGIRAPDEGVRRHGLEAFAAWPVVRDIAGAGADVVLADLGSGNGFPGMPLVYALPACRAFLVESSGRKSDFLEVVTQQTGCADRVQVVHQRIKSPGDLDPSVNIALLRAFPEPSRWIPDLAESGRAVIAWLAQRDADSIAASVSGRSPRVMPLPTHPDSALLVLPVDPASLSG